MFELAEVIATKHYFYNIKQIITRRKTRKQRPGYGSPAGADLSGSQSVILELPKSSAAVFESHWATMRDQEHYGC